MIDKREAWKLPTMSAEGMCGILRDGRHTDRVVWASESGNLSARVEDVLVTWYPDGSYSRSGPTAFDIVGRFGYGRASGPDKTIVYVPSPSLGVDWFRELYVRQFQNQPVSETKTERFESWSDPPKHPRDAQIGDWWEDRKGLSRHKVTGVSGGIIRSGLMCWRLSDGRVSPYKQSDHDLIRCISEE